MTKPVRPIHRVNALTGKKLASFTPRLGETVAEFMDRSGYLQGMRSIVVERDGNQFRPIMRADWSRPITRRANIAVWSAPAGGGGANGGNGSKSIASVLALVAVVALASVVAGPAGAALASGLGISGAAATSVISSLIIMAGGLLISHFLKPTRPKPLAPEYSIDITSNQARLQQPIPVQYGKVHCFPDLAAPTFSDYSGNDQHFHALYSLGVGSFEIHEIGLGSQAVWREGTGTLQGFPTFQMEQVEPDANCTLFPTNVAVSPEVTGQTLPDPYGTLYPDGTRSIGPNGEGQSDAGGPHQIGPYIVNLPQTVATSFQVDLVWGSGLYYTSSNNGSQRGTSCRIECFYYYVDDQGHQLTNPTQAWSDTFAANTRNPYRVTRNFDLPSGGPSGRIAVYVARLDKQGRPGITDSVQWVGLRAYLQGVQSVPYATRLAIMIVADANITPYSSQELYVIATRKIPVFNGATFTVQASRCPYMAALDIWNNADYGGGQPYTNADLATFYNRSQQAATLGIHFDYRFTAQSTIYEAMAKALGPALATPQFAFDKVSVTRDEAQTLPSLHLTDHEIVRGTLELAYHLKDQQTSDGVIVQYLDNQTWKKAEVQSGDPTVKLRWPRRVQLDGCTDRAVATDYARYLQLGDNFRRKTVTLETEADARLLRRGSQVIVQSEMPRSWGSAMRAIAVDTTALLMQFDYTPDFTTTGDHFIRIRDRQGRPFGPVRVTSTANPNVVQINGGDLATVEAQQGVTFAAAVARGDGEPFPSVEFSVGTPMAFVGLVNAINTGSSEGTFKLELINDAPEVYDRGQPVSPLPTIDTIVGQAYPALVQDIHAYMAQAGMVMVLHASWRPDAASVTYLATISYDNGTSWNSLYFGSLPSFDVQCAPGDCLVRIRGQSLSGAPGPWAVVSVAGVDLNFSAANLGYAVSWDDLEASLRDSVKFDPLTAISDLMDVTAIQTLPLLTPISSSTLVSPLEHKVNLLSNAVTQESYQRSTANSSLVSYAVGVQANVDQNEASVLQQFEAQATTNATTATEITTLQTNFTSYETLTSAAISTEIQARTSADAAIASSVTTLNTSFTSYESTTDAAITTEQSVRSAADSANAQSITTLNTSFTAYQTTTNAAITQESLTRSTADSANAQSISTLNTSFTSYQGTTNAALSSESATRATADTAISNTVTALQSTVTTNNTTINASLTTEQQTRAGADSALSTSITTLTSTVNGNTAAISTEIQTRSDAQASQATENSALNAAIGTNATSIYTESQARATADSSMATTISVLQANVGDNTTAIISEQQTRATADSAMATAITNLQSSVGYNTAAILTEQQVRATADSGIATTITDLQTANNNNSAAIYTEAQARYNADGANAASIATLSTTVNGNSASISTLQSSTNGISVQYGVIGSIDGTTGGFIMSGIKRLDGSVSYNVTFHSDVFVDGTFSATKIVDLSITNGKVADNAITNQVYVSSSATDGNVSASISVENSCDVLVNVSYLLIWNLSSSGPDPDAYTYTYQLFVDGNQVDSTMAANPQTGASTQRVAVSFLTSVGGGSHTIRVYSYITGTGIAASAISPILVLSALKK